MALNMNIGLYMFLLIMMIFPHDNNNVFVCFAEEVADVSQSSMPNELDISGQSSFQKGQPSLLYIHVSYVENAKNRADGPRTNQKAIFFPEVDRMSMLSINDTITNFVLSLDDLNMPKYSDDMEIWMSTLGGFKTPRKKFFIRTNHSETYVVGSFSAFIEMNKGEIQSIEWIDGCSECECTIQVENQVGCDDSYCLDNNCAINIHDCKQRGMETCGIKVYLGWKGTDRNNRPCESIGHLPHNFLRFGLSKTYRVASGVDGTQIS